MQRCPYIHEMKERLLGDQQPIEIVPITKKVPEPPPLIMDHIPHHQTVGTVVKLNPDGYGSHTSPTHRRTDRAPLMPRDSPHNDLSYINSHKYPKNAKTSLFIIMSFVYAKLLIVICVAYVISDVVTHNIPLFYYEGFFTYLYGVSILFLLYVFCFLLQESTCCSGGDTEKEVVVKEKKPSKKELAKEKTAKEKEKKKEEKEKKKEEKEKKKKEEKEKDKKEDKKDAAGGKDKKKDKKGDNKEPSAAAATAIPVQPPQVPPGQPPAVVLAAQQQLMASQQQQQDVEAGAIVPVSTTVAKSSGVCKRKRKTTQNDQSHGSFFLRIGAIAFGLGTMIYSGLEFGSWFEIPFTSQCYMILRGINPALQMVFTFMQMYFIFMNSRLNIHRFKVIARFGLMHVVATNICVWIRTLVLEYLKEITVYHKRMNDTYPAVFEEATTLQTINGSELLDNILPQSLFGFSWNNTNEYPVSNGTMIAASCDRINIMGTIVQDSAPYLFPFIIEYSLIGAAVIYVMWKHIGRNPRYLSEEDLEHRLEVMLSRRAVAMAHAQQGRVDCVGASKGLFFGLLLLVGSLICLILFFVLIHHPDLGLLAIYLADVSHCALMALSIIAIIVGFIRVQGLKFKVEEQSDLNDILLRVSAFGLFLYATFSVIAGSLEAFTKESNLLVMITGILSVVQVVLQLLFIADVSRRRVHLPEHDRSKPGRQVVTFLLICNITMWIIYTFEMQKVEANPVQLEFYGFLAWAIVQRVTLPLCIFHRFHSAVTLAEIWKTSYKARLE